MVEYSVAHKNFPKFIAPRLVEVGAFLYLCVCAKLLKGMEFREKSRFWKRVQVTRKCVAVNGVKIIQ